MGDQDRQHANHPHRDQTDESLRAERDRADAEVTEKRRAVEEQADEVLQVARDRADRLMQDTRDAADRERRPRSPAVIAGSERERSRADDIVDRERSDADAALEHERAERRRYLHEFLTVEREATDKHLVGERAHADAAVETRDEFLATVNHDIRSLLGGLELNAGLMLKHAPEGEAGDRVRRYAATSQRLVGRMNRLANDLLDLVGIEAGTLVVVPERVDVATTLSDTIDAFEPIATARGVTLDAEVVPTPLHARVDSGRILQVLANLISNAVKFTPAGGRVSIGVRAEGDEVRFAVRDTGVGIPEAELQRVFERFRQVGRDRRGLGLGLHISKSIVEAHGGRMWAESEPGVGSTVHFVLPRDGPSKPPPRG